MVGDLCRLARRYPLYPLERTFHLPELTALRERTVPRVSWAVLFLKAYALLSADEPRLRQAVMPFPWPHLYEHPHAVGMLAVHREDLGVDRLCWGRFVEPENRSLLDLQAELVRYKTEPVDEIFRRQVRMSRCPGLVRWLGWHLSLDFSGTKRAKRVGTFGMSTLAGQGSINRYHPCLTSSLTYGPTDAQGRVVVTIVFDHRLIDGAPLAAALAHLEKIMQGPLTRELVELLRQSHAA